MVVAGCGKEATTAVAERRDVVGYEILSAKLVTPPSARADVIAPYRAPVDKVMVSVGAAVNKGDVLVQLSFPNVEAAYEQARQNVKAAETALESAKAQYGGEVRELERRLAEAHAEEKRQQALQNEAVEGVQTSEATQNRIAIEEELRAARASMESNLLPYKQQLESAREYLQQAQSGAKLASVRAPISGTVLALNAQTGSETMPDRQYPIATIVDLSALEIHAALSADQHSKVEEGREAIVRFKELPDMTFEGRLFRITTSPDRNEVKYIAIITFQNKEGLAKPDMEVASAAVKTGEVKNVIAVPNGAVSYDSSGKASVQVMVNGEWQARAVEVGLRGEQFTEIRSGLKEGETVQVKE